MHKCFICGFLTESPVAIKLCEFSSVNNHHTSSNAVLFHRSIRLIYAPRTSAVWLTVSYWWCNRCATAFFSSAISPNSPFPSPSPRIFLRQVSKLKHWYHNFVRSGGQQLVWPAQPQSTLNWKKQQRHCFSIHRHALPQHECHNPYINNSFYNIKHAWPFSLTQALNLFLSEDIFSTWLLLKCSFLKIFISR